MSSKKVIKSTLVVAAVVLYGCATPVSENAPRKTLRFQTAPLYAISPGEHLSTIIQYYQPPGSDNLYFLDPATNAFHVLDLSKGRLRLACILPPPGDAFEGIFTVDEQARKVRIFYTDSLVSYSFTGKQAGSYAIPDGDGRTYPYSRFFPPVIRNGNLYISYFRKVEGSFRKPEYFRGGVEAVIRIKTNAFRVLAQGYPLIYRQQSYGFNYQPERITVDGQTHGYLFPNSDSIYFCNTRTGARSTRFFGVKKRPEFRYIPFEKIPHLNESVFEELVRSNPKYQGFVSAPLAGYYLRTMWVPKGDETILRTAVFDRSFRYLGETDDNPGWIIDSSQGLLAMRLERNQIIIEKITW